MEWLEVSIYTTNAGIDPICGRLYNIGVTGVEIKDKDEFERMIKEIYEGKLPSLRENGRKAVENMDIKKIGEKLVKIYNGTAEGGD